MFGEGPTGLKSRPLSVLIVEDDILLGMAIGVCVEDAGYASEGILRKAGFGAEGPEDCILYSRVRD